MREPPFSRHRTLTMSGDGKLRDADSDIAVLIESFSPGAASRGPGSARWRGRAGARWCGWGSWGGPGRGRVRICCKGVSRRDRPREEPRNINDSLCALRRDGGLCNRFGQPAPPRTPGWAARVAATAPWCPPGAETLERAVPTIILECEVRLSARSGPVAVVADRGVWPARTAPRPPPSPRRSGSADRRSRQKGSLSGLIGLERVARPDGLAVCDTHEVQEVYEIGWLAGAPSASVKDGRTVLVGAAVRSREPGSWRCRTDECG